jgi:hypothetical protein
LDKSPVFLPSAVGWSRYSKWKTRDKLWRGYGKQSSHVVILVGVSRESADHFANQIALAGHVTNPYAVPNKETSFTATSSSTAD